MPGRVQILDREKIYPIDEILPLIGTARHIIIDGKEVEANNLRLQCFKLRGTTCVACSLSAAFFALELVESTNYHGWALNLYGINEEGEEVYFTKDHIIPKSKKGPHNLENLQTMCWPCNRAKGDKLPQNNHRWRYNPKTDYDAILEELVQFSAENNIPSIADKVQRGLATAGILALAETRNLVLQLVDAFGANYDELLKMTLAMQMGGPWDYAADLREAQKPHVKVWLIMNAANTLGRPREVDLTPEEFLLDVDRILNNLLQATENPFQFFEKAYQHVLIDSRQRFRMVEGVPTSELDNGFIFMAISGYDAGIIQDGDGFLYVGTKEINQKFMEEQWGLHRESKIDPTRPWQGPKVYFTNPALNLDLVKVIHPGFAIVLTRNFDLARAMVKISSELNYKAVEPPEEAFGAALYRPTSAEEETENRLLEILRPDYDGSLTEEAENFWGEQAVEKVLEPWFPSSDNIVEEFFLRMADIKGKTIFLDILHEKLKRRPLKTKDINKTYRTVHKKRIQKIEELEYFLFVMQSVFNHLPDDITLVQDMAGGAGDLALATGFYLLLHNHPLEEIQVIDPFSQMLGLADFMDRILDHLPLGEELRDITIQTNQTLQQAFIPENSLVIAKHACGDLTDSIIEKWVRSDSPAIGLMTCCQDKAATKSARYNLVAPDGFLVIRCHRCQAINKFGDTLCVKSSLSGKQKCVANPMQTEIRPYQATSQEYWEWLCLASARTNSRDPKILNEGMEAMTILDELRVNYLQRHGFQATLYQTDRFPKGDVIVATRY